MSTFDFKIKSRHCGEHNGDFVLCIKLCLPDDYSVFGCAPHLLARLDVECVEEEIKVADGNVDAVDT